MARVNRKYIDTSEETATVSFNVANMTGDITADLVAINAFLVTLEALTLLSAMKTDILASSQTHAWTLPSSNLAHKEIVAVIHYHDSVTGRGYVYSIPGFDTTFLKANSDFADLDNATVAAFVTNFEAVVTSPLLNPAIVDSIELQK